MSKSDFDLQDVVPIIDGQQLMMDNMSLADANALEGGCRVSGYLGFPSWKSPRNYHHRVHPEIKTFRIKKLYRCNYSGRTFVVNGMLRILGAQSVLIERQGKVSFKAANVLVKNDCLTVPGLGSTKIESIEVSDEEVAASLLVIGRNANPILYSDGILAVSGWIGDDVGNGNIRDVRQIPHYTVEIVRRFWSMYSSSTDRDSHVSIGTSQTGIKRMDGHRTLYCRKELAMHPNHLTNREHVDFFVDCVNEERYEVDSQRRIYVPWAALSFFSRDANEPRDLLRSVKSHIQKEKEQFCDFLYGPFSSLEATNIKESDGKVERFKFFHALCNLRSVDIPESTWERWSSRQYDDAVAIHRPYAFCIAFENQIAPGWVTEKIVNAFLAGCIPIYWGSNDVFDYFNRNAFISASDFDSYQELAQFVVDVDDDQRKKRAYLEEPICTPDGFKRLFPWLLSVTNTIEGDYGIGS